MSLVVNTNVGSLNAQRSLASSGAELKTAMERYLQVRKSTLLQMMLLASPLLSA